MSGQFFTHSLIGQSSAVSASPAVAASQPIAVAANLQTNVNEKSQSSSSSNSARDAGIGSSSNSARDAGIGIRHSEWDLWWLTGVDVTHSPPEPEKEEPQKKESGSKPSKPKLTCPEREKPPPRVCCVCDIETDAIDVFALCGTCWQYSCPRHTVTTHYAGSEDARTIECHNCHEQ